MSGLAYSGTGGGVIPLNVVETLTPDIGGVVTATANNINLLGSTYIQTVGTPLTSTINIDLTADIAASYTTDAGSAVPALNVLQILGGENINTAGATNIVTINLNETIHWSNTNIAGTTGAIYLGATGGVGGTLFMHNYGTGNIWLGQNAGNLTLTTGSATFNTGLGDGVLSAITIGSTNSAGGAFSQASLTSGDFNSSWGAGSLVNLVSGSNNLVLGQDAGNTYTTNESDNIILSSPGVIGDNATIRIGVEATQTSAYMAGIYGQAVGGTNQFVIVDNTGKLGSSAGGSSSTIVTILNVGSGTFTFNVTTKTVELFMWSGGGGGGSGRQSVTTAAGGGAGGAGSNCAYMTGSTASFTSPVSYTVGAGGTGGAAQAWPSPGLSRGISPATHDFAVRSKEVVGGRPEPVLLGLGDLWAGHDTKGHAMGQSFCHLVLSPRSPAGESGTHDR